MRAAEFMRRVRNWAKRNGVDVEFNAARGKGSHGTLYVGERKTTVKSRNHEIGAGLLRKMLSDLDIDKADF